jgi:FkbM family methyltransferase
MAKSQQNHCADRCQGRVGMSQFSIADLHMADGTSREFHYRANSSDENVIKDVFQARQYDMRRLSRAQEWIGFLERQAPTGRRPLIVDAGANIGAATVHFMTTFPTALVVAVEPDLANFELLLKNAAGPNVQAVNAAISSTRGHARVFDPGEGHWGYRTRLIAEDETLADAVPRVTINDIFNSHSGQHFPYIVKVDIDLEPSAHSPERSSTCPIGQEAMSLVLDPSPCLKSITAG